jgi:hypothetical protein
MSMWLRQKIQKVSWSYCLNPQITPIDSKHRNAIVEELDHKIDDWGFHRISGIGVIGG